jgi:transposase-like protein
MLSKKGDISRQLVRVWVQKYEAGALDEDAQAADLLQEYEAKIAALERMVALFLYTSAPVVTFASGLALQ